MDERRRGRYERIYEQLRELIVGRSPDLLAAMATICAVLHAKMPHHFWTGFYLVRSEDALHVGPYQGPLACQVLRSGICADVVRFKRAIVVEDVDRYPGHVACDSRSKSEIVVPVQRGEEVVAVLDIDSDKLGQFSDADVEPLCRVLSLLDPHL